MIERKKVKCPDCKDGIVRTDYGAHGMALPIYHKKCNGTGMIAESDAEFIDRLQAELASVEAELAETKDTLDAERITGIGVINDLKTGIADAQEIVRAETEARLAAEEENKRLSYRDGSASIELLFPTTANPFARIDLKVVDFGVADNCYVVESKEVELLTAELAAEKQARETTERDKIAANIELGQARVDVQREKAARERAERALAEEQERYARIYNGYEAHLAGCAIEREQLVAIGLVDDSGEDGAGEWRNERAEKAEVKLHLMLDFYAAICAIMNYSDGVYGNGYSKTWDELKAGAILGPAVQAIKNDCERLEREAEQKGESDA